jgi:mevalonate kinase
MTILKTFSPGKVILSGEHSVLYGQPALVSSINLGLDASLNEGSSDRSLVEDPYFSHIVSLFEQKFTKKVTDLSFSFSSSLPQQSGLGSSAAFAHVVLKAFDKHFGLKLAKKDLFNLVWEAEHFKHGVSSGVDPMAVVYQGLIEFEKKNDQVQPQLFNCPILKNKHFCLINSGKAKESTKEMAELIKEKSKISEKIQQTIYQMGDLTKSFIKNLKSNFFKPYFISRNQRLLEDLGVVGEKAKSIIRLVEASGGFAKITGSGGTVKGSGFILAYHPDLLVLDSLIKLNNWPAFKLKLA